MNMTPSSAFKDAHDPFEAPASERYARFAFDGLQIRVENNESVLWIIFDRPRKVNALSQQHYNVLHQILDELQLDRSIRVVVLASNGAHFSSGLDFDSHYRDGTPDIETEFYNQIKFSRVTLKLRNIPQPVIALMKGKAVGSGLAYCLAADVRIGDPTVEISVGANRMGSGGADIGLGFLLPRLCGPAVAAELMLTRRWCKAEKCLAIGVVSDIVAPEKLVEEGRKLAEEMLEMSRMGLMVTKAQLNQGAEGIPLRGAITSEDTAQIFSLQTKDAKVINDRFRTRVQKDRKAKPTL